MSVGCLILGNLFTASVRYRQNSIQTIFDLMLRSEFNGHGRCDGEASCLKSNRKRHRSESPMQDKGRLQRLESRMNELQTELSFLRGVIARRERICLVTTCKKTFTSDRVYTHIHHATDPAHREAAASFEHWCVRCFIPFKRKCDRNRHLNLSHPKEIVLNDTMDFYNKKPTAQSEMQSKSMSKVVPTTAHDGLLENASTDRAEPKREEEEDNYEEEKGQDESISNSSNNPETDSSESQSEYRTAIYATWPVDSVSRMAPKDHGRPGEEERYAPKTMQGVCSIKKSDSIPGEQHMVNPQLAQYGTTPISVSVPADGGTSSVLGRHHGANFYLSQHRTAPISVQVPTPSNSREFSDPTMLTNWYENALTSDWQNLPNPAMMTNWYGNPPMGDWQDLQNPAIMDSWCQTPQNSDWKTVLYNNIQQ